MIPCNPSAGAMRWAPLRRELLRSRHPSPDAVSEGAPPVANLLPKPGDAKGHEGGVVYLVIQQLTDPASLQPGSNPSLSAS